MEKNPPLITIGFTCYNAAHRIAKAIKCAQRQTWPNIEILVVDDGSKDGSPEEVKALIKNDPRIRIVVHETNKGTAETRTTLAKNAKGEFMCFFDDDDESTEDRVEKQYIRLTEYEKEHGADIVFCYTNRRIVHRNKNKKDTIGYGIGHCSPEPHGPKVADLILWGGGYRERLPSYKGQMGSGTMILRTNVFKKLGYFDERFWRSAEIDFAVRAAFQGAHFISVDEPLLIQIKTGSENKSGKRPLQFALLLRQKYKNYLKSKRVYLASIAIAHMQFYSKEKNAFAHYFSFAMACLCSPDKILYNTIRRRIGNRSS